MDIAGWITIAVFCAVILIFAVIEIVKFKTMSAEERKAKILTYVKGLVVDAETLYGSGKGKAKLVEVETTFATKSPILYKILLHSLKTESLDSLIELALAEIKTAFEK